MEAISVPPWAFALAAFGVQLWLFCLLPAWVNKDADVLETVDRSFDDVVPATGSAERPDSPA